MTSQLPTPGWYPDPADPNGSRWWDGRQWTEQVQSSPLPPPPGPSGPVVGRSLVNTSGMSSSPGVGQSLIDRYYDPTPRPWWKKKRYTIPAGAFALVLVANALSGTDDGSEIEVVALADVPTSITSDISSTSVLAPSTASTLSVLAAMVESTTTAAPTTVEPTTTTAPAPTTVAPTTVESTTTAAPTTAAPTTVVSTTTAAPATAAPTTTTTTVTTVPPTTQSDCHPSYTGCVPRASDVDCAGGSGDGPAYVTGPISVIGPDVYDLDRDGDGVACE